MCTGLFGCLEQVADLHMLNAEMHKFESHYIGNLVGEFEKR